MKNPQPEEQRCAGCGVARTPFNDRGTFLPDTAVGPVWLVSTYRDGEDLAREPGFPAVLVADAAAQQGKSLAAVKLALLPLLIGVRSKQ